ncbi:STAS domain-containing protein [Fluviispira multicolorata]|uniref:STAS domain-containing protein n=1 Tax=Fluviispira multicolorata TaxID=2654512 RepID=A0A833N7U6_9BACT|nr:STAS domain-containing protein [Fluviispira multicolorata]KAB8033341.1 STAS domain-containing protein [Fluviispira multicolorata]
MSSLVAYANRTFTFTGKLTIYKVSELKNKIIEGYNSEATKSGDFFIDMSAVEAVDAAVLQLLVALKNTIKGSQGNLKIKSSAQTFDSLLDLFGIPADTFPKGK